jgi:hypothetical protein
MTRITQQQYKVSACEDTLTQSRRPVTFRREVFREVCDWYGERLDVLHAPYDGTVEDALRVAEMLTEYMHGAYPEARDGESRIGATDEGGQGKWVISPNLVRVAEAGTPEAAYIGGDLRFAPAN